MATNGYLQLGTAISGSVVVTPPSGTNYTAQPVSFDSLVGGITLSNVNCVFGPVSGSWGTLTVFGVTEDPAGTIPVIEPGTLQAPFFPANGQLVTVPPGTISLIVGSQYTVGPGAIITPPSGPTTSGFVSLVSGAYELVVASGARTVFQMQNTSPNDVAKLIFGGDSAPASGSIPTAILPPLGVWPPPGTIFQTNDAIWATCGLVSGTVLSWIKG